MHNSGLIKPLHYCIALIDYYNQLFVIALHSITFFMFNSNSIISFPALRSSWLDPAGPGGDLQRPDRGPAPRHHRGTRQRQPQPTGQARQ